MPSIFLMSFDYYFVLKYKDKDFKVKVLINIIQCSMYDDNISFVTFITMA